MIHLRIFLPVFFLLYFLLTFLMYAPKKKEKPSKLKTYTLLNNLIWLLEIMLNYFLDKKLKQEINSEKEFFSH